MDRSALLIVRVPLKFNVHLRKRSYRERRACPPAFGAPAGLPLAQAESSAPLFQKVVKVTTCVPHCARARAISSFAAVRPMRSLSASRAPRFSDVYESLARIQRV